MCRPRRRFKNFIYFPKALGSCRQIKCSIKSCGLCVTDLHLDGHAPQQNFSTDPSLYIPLFALCTISLITDLIVKILTDCMSPKLLAHWKALAYIWCFESQCLYSYRRSLVWPLKNVSLEKPLPQYLHLYSRSLVCLLKNVTLKKRPAALLAFEWTSLRCDFAACSRSHHEIFCWIMFGGMRIRCT